MYLVTDRPEVIQWVSQGCAYPVSHFFPAQVIVSGDHGGGQVLFIVLVDVKGGLPALGFLDSIPVSIIFRHSAVSYRPSAQKLGRVPRPGNPANNLLRRAGG